MKEQSHKDEMSAALRGDFQRLRERGVAVELAPQEPAPEHDVPAETPEPTPVAPLQHEERPEDADAPREPEPGSERRGWLSRLAGR